MTAETNDETNPRTSGGTRPGTNDVDELKQFGLTHARAQNIPTKVYREVCARITTDGPGTDGSWVREWSRAARRLEERGRILDACGYYNLARFPYVDGPARQTALDACVGAFRRWSADKDTIEPLSLDFLGGRVHCWTGGLSASAPRPLLVVMGGIVSVKEQWAPLLAQVGKLGMAGVVAEMPGVGENTAPYTDQSWRLLSVIADAVADRADVTRVYALTLSFSGHMALRCAARDSRIRGIVTAGAPVSGYFTDQEWHPMLPRVTVDTLAHLTGTPSAGVTAHMAPWALGADELASLDIPVYYVASRKDEIVPQGDTAFLRRHVRDLHLLEYDEDHGSPRYATETRAWIMHSLLRLRGGRPLQRAVIGTVSGALRGRRRLTEVVK